MNNYLKIIVVLVLNFLVLTGCSSEVTPKKKKEAIIETTDLDIALKNKETIKYLDLSDQGLTEFPKEIFELKRLVLLDLSGNKISSIEGDFKELNELMYLELSGNELTDVPASLVSFSKLDHLHLENNKIKIIQTDLGAFPTLLEINLSSNPLIEFPKSAITSETIELINCLQTFVQEVPDDILETKTIQNLWLPKKLTPNTNKILDSLIATKDVNVQRRSRTLLTYSSEKNENSDSKKIKYFSLEGVQLSEMEKNLPKFKQLEFLDLSNSDLKEIPSFLLELPNLKYIDLSNNQIASVDLSRLPKQLVLLDLSGNKITSSLTLSGFSELTYLFLEKNDLRSIELSSSPKLKMGDFSQNTHLTKINLPNSDLDVLGLPLDFGANTILAETIFYR